MKIKCNKSRKSVKADHRSILAANNGSASVSKIKKFIEDSVNNLQTTDYTNCRLVLDDDLCLYVGYANGFDTEDGYAICAKIAERNDADWADFDYLNMPWNTYNDNNGSTGVFEGDVYDTEIEITPGEDYTQDAQWLANSYTEIRELLDDGKLTIEASFGKKPVKASRIMGAADTSNLRIFVPSNCYVDVVVDSYEQGEGEQVNSWNFAIADSFKTAQELIDDIAESSFIFSSDINDYVFLDGSLQTDATVNGDNDIPTQEELEAWKRGELELYVAHLWVRLDVGASTHMMTEDEAEAFGLSVY